MMSNVKEKTVRLSEIVIEHFKPWWAAVKAKKYLRYVLKGGRGSGKSTQIAIKIIKLMMQYPVSALVVRKVGITMRESVFEELKEAIEILGVSDYWHIPRGTSGGLYLTYIPRGNRIIFRGADDSQKMKSLRISKFPVALLWIEELAEFKTEEEVLTIENSVLRAELPEGLFYAFFYSYNPPKRKQNWVNKKYETQFLPDNTYVHHSTYLDNPYISKAFIDEAEEVKRKSQQKYDHIYGGAPIGSGVVPFDNLEFRAITAEEIKGFSNIRQGIDWGYGVDPFAFVRMHLDTRRRILYIFDELYGVKMSSRDITDWIKDKGYNDFKIIADHEEPRSISEFRTEYGISKITKTKKGPGSVEHGEKWLDELEAIVIDPVRCPNTAKEFEDIDYATDKDGEPRPRLEGKNNHSIDATRYALEEDMKNSEIKYNPVRGGI